MVREMFEMGAHQGMGGRTIANALNQRKLHGPRIRHWNISTVKSMLAINAATFRKALPNICGSPASVGMPISRLIAAMWATQARNFWMSTALPMSSTAAGNTEPS